jgi:hypothetical protein
MVCAAPWQHKQAHGLPQRCLARIDMSPPVDLGFVNLYPIALKRTRIEETGQSPTRKMFRIGIRWLDRSVKVQVAKPFVAFPWAIGLRVQRRESFETHAPAFFFARRSFASFSIVRRCRASPNCC